MHMIMEYIYRKQQVKREKSFAVYWISSKCRETFAVILHQRLTFICFESTAIVQSIRRENSKLRNKKTLLLRYESVNGLVL